MTHRIVHPIKHAGKIHKPGKVVNWSDDVTEDLVELGALVKADAGIQGDPGDRDKSDKGNAGKPAKPKK